MQQRAHDTPWSPSLSRCNKSCTQSREDFASAIATPSRGKCEQVFRDARGWRAAVKWAIEFHMRGADHLALHPLVPEALGVFQVAPSSPGAAPHMRGLRTMMAHGVAGCPRRIDAPLALLLQLDQLRSPTHIVDVAEHLLQGP